MKSPITSQPFTTVDANRLLGLGDQFMEDWSETAIQDGNPDTDYEERAAEWKATRPLLAQAPAMLAVIGRLIQTSDDLHSAVEGTTDQFEAEVSALSAATSDAEKVVALFRTGEQP